MSPSIATHRSIHSSSNIWRSERSCQEPLICSVSCVVAFVAFEVELVLTCRGPIRSIGGSSRWSRGGVSRRGRRAGSGQPGGGDQVLELAPGEALVTGSSTVRKDNWVNTVSLM